MLKTFIKFFLCSLICIMPVFFASNVFASYNQFTAGSSITISEFVYNDDSTPYTSDCTLTVYSPNGTPYTSSPFDGLGSAIMNTDIATGRHYIVFTPSSTVGVWPANISCGTGGVDLSKLDESFMIVAEPSSGPSANDIATAVWGFTGRSLDNISNIVSGVWSAATRTLTSRQVGTNDYIAGVVSSTPVNQVASAQQATDLQSDVTTIKNNVATLITEIGTNNISAIKTKTDTINWSDVSGIATTSGQVKAKTDNINWSDVTGIKTKTDYINWSDVTGIKAKTDDIVWSDVTSARDNIVSILAQTGNISTIQTKTDTINWSDVSGIATTSGQVKAKTDNINWSDVSAIKTATDIIHWADITGIKAKTDFINWGDITATRDNVATVLAQTGDISAIKTSTDYINWSDVTGIITTAGLIKAKTDNINWSDVTGIKTKTDYINWSDVTGIKAKTDTINWADIAGISTLVTTNNAMIQTLDNTNAVWEYLGQVLHSGQMGAWITSLSDTSTMTAGQTLRTKVYVTNQYNATDSYAAPVIKIYDPDRNLVASTPAPMIWQRAGIYEFDYNIPSNATPGQWETVVDTQVQLGQTIETSDYWTVDAALSPPMVAINEITDNVIPQISANITIKNEGTEQYEYHFEWCVLANINDTCEGGNAITYDSRSQLIQPGQSISPNLVSNPVPSAGEYYFKLAVYYGDKVSGATKHFNAVAQTTPPVNPPAGGGGGGNNTSVPAVTPIKTTCNGADFNHDHKVNSIDFSILMSFWKTSWPFRNPCVDINNDKKINSVDFSTLMYQWGTKR